MSITFTVPVSSFPVGNVPAGKGLATAILFTVVCSANTVLTVDTTGATNASLSVLGWRLTGPTYKGGGSVNVGATAFGHEITLFVRAKSDALAPPLAPFSTKFKIHGVGAGDVLSAEITVSGIIVRAEVTRAAVDLALDRSKFMSATTVARTKTACLRLLDFMTDADWLGIVTFTSSATRKRNIKPLTAANRSAAITTINALAATTAECSVYRGATACVNALNNLPEVCECAPAARAMLLLSMGQESVVGFVPPGSSPASTLGIALGSTAGVIPAVATQYFMLGNPSDPGEMFRLEKFLLQSLAQLMTGLVVILDPAGTLSGPEQLRVPFEVADTDSNVRILLLVDDPELVQLELELEAGKGPIRPRDFPGAALVRGTGSLEFSLDRTVLEQDAPDEEPCRPHKHAHQLKPGDKPPAPAPSKTWHAVLSLSDSALTRGARLKPIPYSLIVFAESDLRFSASAHLDSPSVGGSAFLSAWLTEHQAPITKDRVRVWAEVTYPDGGSGAIELREAVEGRYEAQIRCSQPGAYRYRILAAGTTFRGKAFKRELTSTTFTRAGEGFDCCPPPTRGEPSDVPGTVDDPQEEVDDSIEAEDDLR